jgi:peptidoglycan/xylan/chitin deacetylase (PgdA/CDA1 family)
LSAGQSNLRVRKLIRVLKLVASVLFFSASLLRDVMHRLIGRRRSANCVVIYYHHVSREQRSSFAHQMDMLKRWTIPINADQRAKSLAGHRYVAVTFDDGFESVLENAVPELESRKIPSTVFVVTQNLGQAPCWISPKFNRDKRVMSVEQLRSLQSRLVTVGSHSLTHMDLTKLTESNARREIAESRKELQRILEREVMLFSFPYGAFNDTLIQYCREAGYERVFTTLPKLALRDEEEFALGRMVVEPTDWRLEFLLKILGAYRWLPLAFSWKRKMRTVFDFGTSTKALTE